MLTSYVELGFEHILDSKGYDHILFVVVLCVAYKLAEWRQMLLLVTAFTFGHTLTLGLASMELVSIDSKLVETLIPVTILLSAMLNIWEAGKGKLLSTRLHYGIALFFGLIHGLGFSNFFRALVMPDESIVPMLFSFNIGVELGQIIIVLCTLLLTYIAVGLAKVMSHQQVSILVSAAAGLAAILLLLGWL